VRLERDWNGRSHTRAETGLRTLAKVLKPGAQKAKENRVVAPTGPTRVSALRGPTATRRGLAELDLRKPAKTASAVALSAAIGPLSALESPRAPIAMATEWQRGQPIRELAVPVCACCGGPRQILGAVTEPHAVRQLLAALGLAADSLLGSRSRPSDPPVIPPPRRRRPRLLSAGSPEAPAAPVPASDTLPAPLATRHRAAVPIEGASPTGRRGTGPGDKEREMWLGVPRFLVWCHGASSTPVASGKTAS
jgi:hypothetical protein